MNNYTLHFIIAFAFAIILPIVFCHSWKKRFLGTFISSVFFYCLFYDYDYILYLGETAPIIIAYLGAFFSCSLYLFFSNYKVAQSSPQRKELKIIVPILLLGVQGILLLYSFVIPWAIDSFPLSNVEAVLFTLFAGTKEGAEEFVLSSFITKVLTPACIAIAIFIAAQISIALILKRNRLNFEFGLWKFKQLLYGPSLKRYVYQIQKCVTIIIALYCVIISLVLPGIVMSASFKALFQQPIDSSLYRHHFIDSNPEQISVRVKPKNLIVILLESMETNFADHTPEIKNLENEYINFAPGGESVAGTSWTIAAITAKLCGVPLNMPMGINEYLGKLPTYLPGAYCLMDLLENKKYNQVFIQGSSGNFTQIREFAKAHGHIDLHDLEHYKEKGKVPNDYNVFWGIEDRKLYQYAKEELDSLYNLDVPFALYLTTMDTHQPDGYVDEECNQEFKNVEKKYIRALRCASSQLYDFVLWAKTQPWFENTVISVMGDHTQPRLSAKAGVPKTDSLYWTNFMINSAIQKPIKTRQYTSLDMYPTLLEAMGFELEHRGIALGRSLFSDSLTMLELYGRKTLDSLLRERSIQYDKFLFGN